MSYMTSMTSYFRYSLAVKNCVC